MGLSDILDIFRKKEGPPAPAYKRKTNGPRANSAEEVLDGICSLVQRGSQLSMEKQVHDIIIHNVDYRNTGRREDHSSDGILKNHYGVCDGISKLAHEVFSRIGIQSEVIFGDLCMLGTNQGPHAWNLVCIDGRWFHLDITEDLALSQDCYHYDYFNLSDAEMSYDHAFKNKRHPCVTEDCGYYKTNGLFARTINDYERLWDLTLRKNEKKLTVQVPRGMEPDKIRDTLVDYGQRIALKYYNTVKIRYSYNSDQCVFSIMLCD